MLYMNSVGHHAKNSGPISALSYSTLLSLLNLGVRSEGVHGAPSPDVVEGAGGVLMPGDQEAARRVHAAGGHRGAAVGALESKNRIFF